MTFRADWRLPILWMVLALFNVALSGERFHRHGWHNAFAWIQLVLWSSIFVVWGFVLATSWQVEEGRLVMKRWLFTDRNIPYEAISSIDWTNQKDISLTIGGAPMFGAVEKRTVKVRDMPGFLKELERHVSPGALKI